MKQSILVEEHIPVVIESEALQWMECRIIDYLYGRLAAANSETRQVCGWWFSVINELV